MNWWKVAAFALLAAALYLGFAWLAERQKLEAADKIASDYIGTDLIRKGWTVVSYRKPAVPSPSGTTPIAAGRGSTHWGPIPGKAGGPIASVPDSGSSVVPPEHAETPPSGQPCDLDSLTLDATCEWQAVDIGRSRVAGIIFQSATLSAPDGSTRKFPRREATAVDVDVPAPPLAPVWHLNGLVGLGVGDRGGAAIGLDWTSPRRHGAWMMVGRTTSGQTLYAGGYSFRLR